MKPQRYRVGDVIRGDHRVLAVYETELGVVYVCRQDLPGGKHVYKALKTFRLATEVARALFERELANWVRLPPHPNIVQAKDADTVNHFLVLEFVPGPNLREVAWNAPIHPRHFFRWAAQVAGALRFLHDNHFLHRDLRPANVLVDAEHGLTAKISDLGIGKPFDPSAASHTVIGTFTYMAPEVYEGRTDYRSDIFSFGATLYFLLTGAYAAKLSTRGMGAVTSPSRLVPSIPEEVAACVLRCLAAKPEERYAGMGEVAAELAPLRDWPVDGMPYERCSKHDYSYYSPEKRLACPFCFYAKTFSGQEAELERMLKRGR